MTQLILTYSLGAESFRVPPTKAQFRTRTPADLDLLFAATLPAKRLVKTDGALVAVEYPQA